MAAPPRSSSRVDQAVRTAFLKDDSLCDLLQLQYRPTAGPSRMIRIKLEVDRRWCLEALEAKIESIDWARARDDVRAFVRSADLASLVGWGRDFFLGQAAKLPA